MRLAFHPLIASDISRIMEYYEDVAAHLSSSAAPARSLSSTAPSRDLVR